MSVWAMAVFPADQKCKIHLKCKGMQKFQPLLVFSDLLGLQSLSLAPFLRSLQISSNSKDLNLCL